MSMSVQKSQVHKMAKVTRWRKKGDYAWLMISRCSRSHSRQAEEQAQDLKCKIKSLNLTVEELSKAHALAEATLRERDELIFAQCEKIRLLEEQYEKYFALKETESLKVEITSLQTENKVLKSKETKLINLEKVYGVKESVLLKDIDQMKSQVSEILEKHKISNQEMKQQSNLFEEDKRMFVAKNEFLEKVSSSMQKEYNDLLASNDVLNKP
ncbi:hypothetical protein Tco_1320759 [Tanacetum coccineum]